ncbi:ornithine decarboxylase 1 [Dunaliella salina]|uniref:ornithine decarboxylase n=1 Tax=Dunaliella salina TaxID=3046 RepID=A0ABQ7H0D0_DUNSA|nr:ornithine decarboxylase 1 [Dunaliella salina]|eukprot:KAF5840290.1 ornithine decarboxylase 1 [Dunaliella salina]
MAPGLSIGKGETSVEMVAPLAHSPAHSPLMEYAELGLAHERVAHVAQLRRSIDATKADEHAVHHDASHGPMDPRISKNSWQYQATRNVAAAAVLHDLKAEHLPSGGPRGVERKAIQEIARRHFEDTFYIVDLGNTTRLYKAWKAAMPAVKPYYAVKCNPEPGLLRLLMALGTGFDCASKGELRTMLKLGVHPSNIIFAHPCKRPSDILYAKEHGVEYTTFDTESELHKVAALNPGFKLVLRIRADDPGARVPLGIKYGADVGDAPKLLDVAHSLGLNVVGVSFHVGSACKDLATFTGAIESARLIFDQAEALGYNMELLDVGGGFTGHFDACGNVMFGEIANTINKAVARHFPPERGVRVIAEPGRYFAETSASLLTPIYGHRDRVEAATGVLKKDYWITDGLYGSFNCILYDGQNPQYQVVRTPLLPEPTSTTTYKSTLWGPTCDSADCVYKVYVFSDSAVDGAEDKADGSGAGGGAAKAMEVSEDEAHS